MRDLQTPKFSCHIKVKCFPLSFQSIQDLQSSLRDGAVVLQGHSDELKRAMSAEREAIHASYTQLYDAIRRRYEAAMREIDG